MCCPERDWVDLLQALLTPTIAIAGVVITVLQWSLSKAHFRHEQFDRRFGVFEAVRSYIGSVLMQGYPTPEAQQRFLAATQGARFIFNAIIAQHIKEVWDKTLELEQLRAELEGLPAGDERAANVRRQRQAKDWLYDHLRHIEAIYEPHLAVEQ